MIDSVIGFALLGVVVVLWVGSSTLIQTIFEDSDFNKPFFLTYFSTTLFMLYFIDMYRRKAEIQAGTLPSYITTLKTAAQFCPLWFGANYLYNLSLDTTSIASSTILSSTSGIFTLLLSIFLIKATPDIVKFIAVLVSFLGITFIAMNDWDSDSETAYGDFFALGGAVAYSLYCIFISIKGDIVYLPHMFACVGFVNFICLMPVFPILHYTGVETFEFPSGKILGFLFLNGLFGTVLSDVLWAFSVKYLNPALSTLGITLTIPLSMVVDAVLHGYTYPALYIVGALMVILGFVIMASLEHPKIGPIICNKGIIRKCRESAENGETKYILSSKQEADSI
jgi:solute carrier family 35, member F5